MAIAAPLYMEAVTPPRLPLPALLAGLVICAAAAGGAWWWLHAPQTNQVEIPVPPEPPRLADSAEYERCLSLLREDSDAAMAYAEEWAGQGGGEGARHCSALAMIGLGAPERAGEQLERIARDSQASAAARAAVLGQAGQAWMMAGDAARAFGATTMALTLEPQDTDLMTDRAVALAAMRRYSEALQELDNVLRLDPDRVEAMVFRASALRNMERVEDAMRAIQQALAATPDNPEALLERGILHQLRGEEGAAREDWERVISVAPETPAAELAQQNLALNEAGLPQR